MKFITKDWEEFYHSRVCSERYYNHFTEKYKVFLQMIENQKEDTIFEVGCGLGMVSLALGDSLEHYTGIDLCPYMVNMANINTHSNSFHQGDMFQNSTETLSVTHGVLEHFEDDFIVKVIKLYPNSIHYVPLDKYITPSFGDERLLPYEHWIDLLNPSEWVVFNDGHDLTFKI